MCKLCGTNRPAYVPKQVRPSSASQTFREISRDYIGEFPCRVCYYTALTCTTKDTDTYITDKLFVIATRGKKRQVRNERMKMNNIRKTVCRSIISIESLSTGHIAYRLTVRNKQFGIRKVFHDIDDAIKERDWRLKKIKEKKPSTKVIEKHISFSEQKTFRFQIRIKGKSTSKTFKTLKEAQAFKAFILKEGEMIK